MTGSRKVFDPTFHSTRGASRSSFGCPEPKCRGLMFTVRASRLADATGVATWRCDTCGVFYAKRFGVEHEVDAR